MRRPPLRLVALALAAALVHPAPAAAVAVLHATGTGPTGESWLFEIDSGTGAATPLHVVRTAFGGQVHVHQGGLAYDPFADVLYATGTDSVSASRLFRIDRASGIATVIGGHGGTVRLDAGGLAFDTRRGVLWATGQEFCPQGCPHTFLYSVDPATGAATRVGPTGGDGTHLHGLGFDRANDRLLANGYESFAAGASTLFEIAIPTSAIAAIGPHGVTESRQLHYADLELDPWSGIVYALGSVSASMSGLYRVDPATGQATLVGPCGAGFGLTDGGLELTGSSVLATGGEPRALAGGLSLSPNPFAGALAVGFALAAPAAVELHVLDLSGRRTATVAARPFAAGRHAVRWDGRDDRGATAPSGLYLVRAVAHGAIVGEAKAVRVR